MRKKSSYYKFHRSAGASLVEYSLLIAVLASFSIASTQSLGLSLKNSLHVSFDGGTSMGGDFDPAAAGGVTSTGTVNGDTTTGK